MRRMEEGLESQKGGTQKGGENTREKKDQRKSEDRNTIKLQSFSLSFLLPWFPILKTDSNNFFVFLCKKLDERN